MATPTPSPPKEHATPRLKIVKPDFEALRAKRDAALEAIVEAFAKERGINRKDVLVHVSPGGCYCSCPDGPCEHEWGGWREFETEGGGGGGEQVCKRCGMGAMSHSLRCGP